MKYKVFADRVKLLDSYKVPKVCFGGALKCIRDFHPDCPLWQRTDGSLKREWAAHNLAYALGIKREKTKDCDLNFELSWYMKLAYGVVGTVALWVIK